MSRFLGVEDGHVSKPGGPGQYKPHAPEPHKGLDVWAPPGSPVYVPLNADWMHVVRADYDARGQAFGWISFCHKRYGFAAAHFNDVPRLGRYEPGDLIGHVAGRVLWTPHVHWAMAEGFVPPDKDRDNVNPYLVWKGCVREETP